MLPKASLISPTSPTSPKSPTKALLSPPLDTTRATLSPRKKFDLRFWLDQLEEWSPLKINSFDEGLRDPSPNAVYMEHLWVVLCEALIRRLECEADAEAWLDTRLHMVEYALKYPTLRDFLVARQDDELYHDDEDLIREAPGAFQELLKHIPSVKLEDQFSLLDATRETHLRIASYHDRIATSHRALVRRLREEVEVANGGK